MNISGDSLYGRYQKELDINHHLLGWLFGLEETELLCLMYYGWTPKPEFGLGVYPVFLSSIVDIWMWAYVTNSVPMTYSLIQSFT